MNKEQKYNTLLALDIATTTGWAIMHNGNVIDTGHFTLRDMNHYHLQILELIDLWKPCYVIAAKPTRFYNTVFLHGKYFGAAMVALGKRGLEFWMDKTAAGKPTLPVDSKMKKSIIGKGKCTKEEIMAFTGIPQEDESDSVMFCHYLEKTLNAE